ncbi:molybdate ABC transporter substrate-binding protein [Anaerotruncus sp. DFI.9.16]|uniref:molybdate ABC transporter substrate-binding protein n=1 Tax=Anaerotruncus sp. DFI.9.16 TaxID=2965275 RepID=UPI00210A191E|nr:molybdate ABC transporter substrate-binding protein [Anaerotruncus sp. DFI.9.16]MCQ4897595.1 molybdate ABC transporter substrate-binding protein [Anaerotruncus sp. DFI.9.16]
MKKFFSVLLAALMLFTVAGCGASEPAPAPAEPAQEAAPAEPAEPAPAPESEPAEEPAASGEPVTILVAAAASLEYSYKDELIPMFTEKYPWITVEGTYDSSGKLQTQIEEGLEADVFMSAATKQMNALKDESLIDADSIVDLLENKIVLIAPAGSEPAAKSFETVTDAATIAVGDPESVPVGQYSKEAFTNLGIWDAVAAKASLGTNVTEVLNWVAEGSADVGVVYATDAATTDKVQVVAEAPEGSLEKKVVYPVGIVSASQHKDAARLFVEFLQSDEALTVFEEYGFTPNK